MTVKTLFRLAAGFIVLAALIVAGCGDDNNPATGTVAITPSKTAAAINTPITLTVDVKDLAGVAAVDGTTVTLSTTAGILSATTATTTAGKVTVTITSAVAGPATVTATSSVGGSASVDLSFTDPNAIATVALSANKTSAAITTNITLTATITTASGNPAPNGTVVTFATTAGTLSATTATTTGGVATVTITSATAAAPSVTASASGKSSSAVNLTFSDPNAIGTVTLAADKTTATTAQTITFTATVQTVSSTPAPNGTVVTFATTGGTLSATTTTTTGGTARVTLSSAAAASASVTAAAGGKTSTGVNVTFTPPPPQPTQAIVTVALTGTLSPTQRQNGSFQRIGGATVKIGYSTTKGLGTPVSAKIGIGLTADIFAANTATNPTATGAGWASTILPDVAPTVGTLPGDFQTLTFPITAGNFPTAQDFFPDSTSTVIDDLNASLAGIINVTIKNVQIQ